MQNHVASEWVTRDRARYSRSVDVSSPVEKLIDRSMSVFMPALLLARCPLQPQFISRNTSHLSIGHHHPHQHHHHSFTPCQHLHLRSSSQTFATCSVVFQLLQLLVWCGDVIMHLFFLQLFSRYKKYLRRTLMLFQCLTHKTKSNWSQHVTFIRTKTRLGTEYSAIKSQRLSMIESKFKTKHVRFLKFSSHLCSKNFIGVDKITLGDHSHGSFENNNILQKLNKTNLRLSTGRRETRCIQLAFLHGLLNVFRDMLVSLTLQLNRGVEWCD